MGRKKIIETSNERFQRSLHAIALRSGRSALGLSQREFGEVVGIHYSSIARFENGQMRLKPLHIETIFKFLSQSGLIIVISRTNGITIQIPPHMIEAMEAIEGIKVSTSIDKASDPGGM